MSDLKNYIQSLSIEEKGESTSISVYPVARLCRDTGSKGLMNYRSLQSFTEGVSAIHREKVLNSFLLAQRAASKAFPSHDRISEWYDTYFDVLNRLGWVFEENSFTVYKVSKSKFDIYTALLDVITSAVGGNLLDIIKKTIDSFRSLSEGDKRFAVFEKYTTDYNQGSFQIGAADDTDGALSVSMGAFILKSKARINKILFFKSDKKNVDFRYSQFKGTLDEALYTDEINEQVKTKLGDIGGYISDIDI